MHNEKVQNNEETQKAAEDPPEGTGKSQEKNLQAETNNLIPDKGFTFAASPKKDATARVASKVPDHEKFDRRPNFSQFDTDVPRSRSVSPSKRRRIPDELSEDSMNTRMRQVEEAVASVQKAVNISTNDYQQLSKFCKRLEEKIDTTFAYLTKVLEAIPQLPKPNLDDVPGDLLQYRTQQLDHARHQLQQEQLRGAAERQSLARVQQTVHQHTTELRQQSRRLEKAQREWAAPATASVDLPTVRDQQKTQQSSRRKAFSLDMNFKVIKLKEARKDMTSREVIGFINDRLKRKCIATVATTKKKNKKVYYKGEPEGLDEVLLELGEIFDNNRWIKFIVHGITKDMSEDDLAARALDFHGVELAQRPFVLKKATLKDTTKMCYSAVFAVRTRDEYARFSQGFYLEHIRRPIARYIPEEEMQRKTAAKATHQSEENPNDQ